jgi:phage portal protein BeeE
LKSLKNRIEQRKALPQGQFQIINGTLTSISDNGKNYVRSAYQDNDLIYSILNLIATKAKVPEWSEYEIQDESSLKQYVGLMNRKDMTPQDFRRALDLKHKALKPVKAEGKLSTILKYPNELETFNDFVANGIIYKFLTGNKFIWADILEAGANKGLPNSLWLLPSHLITILAGGEFPKRMPVGYQLIELGIKNLPKEEVLHEKTFNPDWNANGQHLYGQSPLKAALNRLNRNNSATTAAAASFQNQGIKGVLYVKNQVGNVDGHLAVEQANALKRKIATEYTGENAASAIATSGYEVGWAQMGYNPVELAILESELQDLRFFCNVFGGVPSQLLNDPENKVYNNTKEGEIAFTTRCVIPELVSTRNSLNRKFMTDWGYKDKNRFIDFDQTVFTELDEDIKDKVEWITKLKGLPPNRVLELLNIERVDNPLFDEPWITQDMGQPLSEWELNDVDKNLDEEEDQPKPKK